MPDGRTILETERLAFRALVPDDLDALAALYGDPEVRRYFPEGTLTHEETREELEWIIDVYYERYGFGLWATILRETGELIGRCGLLPWRTEATPTGELALKAADEHPVEGATYEIELAYLLGKEQWGRGLGSEAARAVVDHAFGTLRLPRLICLFDPQNQASRRVAEHVGFTFERDVTMDGERQPVFSLRANSERSRRS
jgi:[ribosomal protein S5]-alanine N-acetyltransferase